MTTAQMWRTEAGTMLTAEVGTLRLVVELSPETDGSVRFQVYRKADAEGPGDLSGDLIAAGVRGDVRAAMAAAEDVAASATLG